MQPFASLPKSISALLLLAACVVSAAPAADASTSGVQVMVRGEDGSFVNSPEMVQAIEARNSASGEAHKLSKRSHATVSVCEDAGCSTNCRSVYDGSFSQSTSCIQVVGTQCIIVSNLDDANIQYWSGSTCNGRHTSYGACGTGTAHIGAPNTNSLAVQTGCL